MNPFEMPFPSWLTSSFEAPAQCSCEDFWRDKITCNPCTTGAYPRDNWSVTTATNTDVNSDSMKSVPSV